ncbi:MAG: hypothetical protein DRG32_00845 [Deltaproteobacteria bacterium]|nr:MAG: hypothetical protein DRG32_00845 [Deltaproteobacteria bacterium]
MMLEGKVKVKPEDFQVEEVLELKLSPKGPYSYYRLWKRDLNTMAAIEAICSKWGLTRDRMGFCGLKDKRAITTQYISIYEGPEEDLEGQNFRLTFLGKGGDPLEIGQARGNIFTVTLRSISPKRVLRTMEVVERVGFVNYFGRQRFASDLFMERPIVRYFLEGDYETALKEYLVQHSPSRKRLLKLWGHWRAFLGEAGHLSVAERAALKIFIRKGDAERAFRALPKPIKLFFLFSYQSLLWNRAVARFIRRSTFSFPIPFIRGEDLWFYVDPGPLLREWKEFRVPFISEEALCWEGPAGLKEEILKVMDEEGVTEHLDAEVLGLKVFAPGERDLISKAQDLRLLEAKDDQLRIRFFLPAGSYATVFLSKLLAFPEELS